MKPKNDRKPDAARRLVCLTMDYPPMLGGVARYLFELQRASGGRMEVWVPKGHRLEEEGKTHLRQGFGGRGKKEEGGGEGVKRVNFWWVGWPKWLPLVKRCFEVGRGNAVLVSHVFPVGTAAWIASFFGGPDYFVLFHGTDLARVRSRWKRWLLSRIANRAGGLFVNSQATAKALQRLVSGAKPTIVTPGVNVFDGPERQKARNDLNINEHAVVILAVGRLVERKGIDVLIEAVTKLDSGSNIVLAVVGQGPYAAQLHKLAALMGVEVRWVEGATDEDVNTWYAAADVFCLPAREQADDVEGFGIVFLEAAAAGLPVIAGKGWGTAEAVVGGVTGLLVDPTPENVVQALKRLFEDGELRAKLGRAGRERAGTDFRWSDRWARVSSQVGLPEFQNSVIPSPDPRTWTAHLDEIDVIIPCYNNAAELRATLESLSRQTLKPHEVVVVDNLSDDHPENVVNGFLSRLPVRCVRFEKERGAPAARNYGFTLTKAPYVLFLDADTVLENDALQKMRDVLAENRDAAFAYPNFYWGKILFRGKPWDSSELKKLNFIHTTALAKRAALESIKNTDGTGPFDPGLKKFQDWDLWLTLSENGLSGKWIDEVLFSVTQQKNGMSRWLPAFVHRIPWPLFGWMPKEIRRYREAEAVIRKKHGI